MLITQFRGVFISVLYISDPQLLGGGPIKGRELFDTGPQRNIKTFV